MEKKRPNRTPTVKIEKRQYAEHFADVTPLFAKFVVSYLLDIRAVLLRHYGDDVCYAEDIEKLIVEHKELAEEETV